MDVSTKKKIVLMVETSIYGVSLLKMLFKKDLKAGTLLHLPKESLWENSCYL